MTTQLLTIFTRTPLHVGAGASVGAVDQPVIRERHTRFPVIPGSALKGVLADLFMDKEEVQKVERKDKDGNVTGHDHIRIKERNAWILFGDNSNKNGAAHNGALLVGESKLLAFPVRSAKGCFAFVTCPLALERFNRDTGLGIPIPQISTNESIAVLQDTVLTINGSVILEEYPLNLEKSRWTIGKDSPLKCLSDDAAWLGDKDDADFGKRLAVISDELFQYFVENDCEIAQHNRIDDEKGVVEGGALFNQENVPSEAMFYCVMYAKDYVAAESEKNLSAKQVMKVLEDRLNAEGKLLQIGADITTGLGWCSVKIQDCGKKSK